MPRLRLVRFFIPFAALTLLSCPNIARTAKQPAPKPLRIEWMMRGPELYGTEPTDVRWSLDSKRVYFRWKEPGQPRRDPLQWYLFDTTAPKGTKPTRLSPREAENIPPVYDWSDPATDRDEKLPAVIYEREGDLFRVGGGRVNPERLTDTPAIRETEPTFDTSGVNFIFRQGDNLFSMGRDIRGEVRQLTDIRTGPAPKEEIKKTEGTANLAERVESELFDSIRARSVEREKERARRREREERRVRAPFYLNDNETVRDLIPSAKNGPVVAFLDTPAKGTTPSGVVPQYINEDGFASAPKARPNVGWEKNGADRCVLLDTNNGKAVPVTLPSVLKERDVRFLSAKFSPVSGRLAVSARSLDRHDRWIFFVDTRTGAATVADTLYDPAWVNGPGWNAFGWTEDGEHLYCVNEEDGWARVTLVGIAGAREVLTAGKSESYDAFIRPLPTSDNGGNRGAGQGTTSPAGLLYFTSSEGDLGQRHFFRRPLAGGENVNLTRALPGWNEATLSPDGKSLAVVHSYTNKPPELFVMDARPDAPPRQITVSPSPEWRAFPWRDVPVVKIPARDGTPVYARLYSPSKRTRATGAAVVFVHGAGYLQNVDKAWTEYPREFMFHHFLAERGYTVLDVDYRGSSGYGRDFRTGIYKHMGGKDLSDVTDSVRWLVENHRVDPKRVGIYGGSYGGFLTLMALFTEPKTYRAGAALRPVTDWTKYNHGYTSPILGLPQEDEAAYRRSSPIFFAEGLTGSLLMCHGMRDDNVFFQDTVRLTQRLIELGKTDHFETAIYPVESHGFTEPTSWTDEYKRIFSLFERTIGEAK